MTYKIVQGRRAWWPVKFLGVTEEGRVVENKIEFRFFVHSEDENAQLLAEANKLPARAQELVLEELGGVDVGEEEFAAKKLTVMSKLYAETVQKLACDWRGVGAENGDPLKWEPDSIRLLMNEPGVFEAAVEAYGLCRRGGREARAGN